MELLDHMVILFRVFLRSFHTVFHSGYTNLHFPPWCTRVFFSCKNWPTFLLIAIQTAMRWYLTLFDLHFWWLAVLSIFLCACCPFVCLPWKDIYLGLSLIFSEGLFVFWYWIIWAVHVFWISYRLQVFIPIPLVVFSFFSGFLCCEMAFNCCYCSVTTSCPTL